MFLCIVNDDDDSNGTDKEFCFADIARTWTISANVQYWKVLSRTNHTADIGSAKRVDDETGFPVVLFQHLTGQKLATRAKVTG